MKRKIQLTRGKFAIVDEADYEKTSQYRWFTDYAGYPARDIKINGKKKRVWLHRWLMGAKKGQIVDHKNRNPLDNRRTNLRFCTNRENTLNSGVPKNNTSGYKGVNCREKRKKWRSFIKVNRKQIFLGYYDNPKEAAEAYNRGAKKYFGEFACPNQI